MITVPTGFFIPGVSGLFDPLALSPDGWWDAADSARLFNATSGGGTVSADGTVKRLEDKSGNGYHVTQENGPIYKTSIYNSLPALRFNGSSQYLTGGVTDLLRNCSGSTLVAVRKSFDLLTPFEQIINVRTNSSNLTLAQLEVNNTAGHSSFAGRRLQADTQQRITGTASTAGDLGVQLAVVDYSSANANLFFNGTSIASSSSFQTSGTTANLTSQSFGIGGRPDGAQFFNGDICEAFIFNRALSTDDRIALQNYLAIKWGI
jgi:hypothetical protein